MEEAEAQDQAGTESAAQRARLYTVLADTVEQQTTILTAQSRILAQIEKDLKDRPTKVQGLAWIMVAFAVLFVFNILMFGAVLRVSNQIVSCTTVDGKCYKREQAASEPFLRNLNLSSLWANECAAKFPGDDARIETCYDLKAQAYTQTHATTTTIKGSK